MKILKILLIVSALGIVSACNKKQPITADKENYIGLWEPEEQVADETLQIQINADGTGRYASTKPGKQVEYNGNVYFLNGNEFAIGGKLIRKKISIDRPPVRIVESIQPYKYHYTATFDDQKFKRTE